MGKKVIVAGGGAAGMAAAGFAAANGHDVTLLEKNDRLGKKLYITGKGRCNLTNAADVPEMMANIPGNHAFLYSALVGFDSAAVIAFFESLGLRTKVERGGRVFPASNRSADVVDALARFMKRNGVCIRLGSEVAGVVVEAGEVRGVHMSDRQMLEANAVIVATGGLSYPTTGSTGDGYAFAKAAGHTVTKLHPSLVPLLAKEAWVPDLQGVSLKNVGVAVKAGGKTVFTGFGEMLFTHFGVSGPLVLSASRAVLGMLDKEPVMLIDLKPALTEKELDARVLRDFAAYANKDFINALDDLLPQKMIPVIVSLSGVDARKKVRDFTKNERKNLVALLKGLRVTLCGSRGFKEAVITAGGVKTSEIDPATMESKLVKGLRFAGEVIDADALTGGFNLQIAFATGFAAGQNI